MRAGSCALRSAWGGSLLLLACIRACGASAGPLHGIAHATAFAPLSRQLQDDGGTNETATNETASACIRAVRAEVGLEQCEIDYREADCDGANTVPWTSLSGPIIWLYVFGVLVMFLSLSVVCDEFFVPGATAMSIQDPQILQLAICLDPGAVPAMQPSRLWLRDGKWIQILPGRR